MNISAQEPEQKEASASLLSGLIETAQTRHHQLGVRILIAVTGALIWALSGSTAYAFSWIALVCLSQLLDTWAWASFRNNQRTIPASRVELLSLCISVSQSSAVYLICPAILWGFSSWGKVFAALWFCGAMLHVVLHMHHDRRIFTAAMFPLVIYLFGLPIHAYLTDAEMGRLGAASILIGAFMYAGHLALAVREYRQTSVDMRLAREQAVEKQTIAEQASQTKSVFLANISHEIRTPMNGILGMAAALDDGDLSPEQAQKLTIIRESGDLLLTVLNDLLDFSKIEADHIEFEETQFSLCDMAKRVESLHRPQADKKKLEFSVCCNGDTNLHRRVGDPHRLGQVLHNLVANAIKFTDNGSVRVRIRTSAHSCESPVIIEVSDTGIGLTPDQEQRIFAPFSQADASTTRKFGGTGLGLSIAKRLIDAMGGTIGVRSTIGGGATFIIELPLKVADVNEADTAKMEEQVPNQQQVISKSLKFLAAEDNAVNRAVLNAFLNGQGHQVEFAEDGLQALETFMNGSFDAVLMDISMPIMDGVEAMRQIRFAERQSKSKLPTPIIAVSAHAMEQQIEEYLEAGFDGYVTKPINAQLLTDEIARVLQLHGGSNTAIQQSA